MNILHVIPIDRVSTHSVPRFLPSRWQAAYAGLEAVQWMWTTYINGSVGLIVADMNTTQAAILAARPHVFPVTNLDDTVPNTNVRNNIRSELETALVPGLWVVTGMTYRHIMRRVGWEFDYYQRVVGKLLAVLFDGSKTLDTTVSQCTTAQQTAFSSACADMGISYTATGATTLRDLIGGVGNTMSGVTYFIDGNIGRYSV